MIRIRVILLILIILSLAVLIVFLSGGKPRQEKVAEELSKRGEQPSVKREAVIMEYEPRRGSNEYCYNLIKMGDRIYSFCYSMVRYSEEITELPVDIRDIQPVDIRDIHLILMLDGNLTPLYYVKLDYHHRPIKPQKFNESRFLLMKAWCYYDLYNAAPGGLIMYNSDLSVLWELSGNFTDFELINSSIYALEYKEGDYYLDRISGDGKILMSVKVIDREETGGPAATVGDKFNISWYESTCGFPNLEYIDGKIYLLWYDKPEVCNLTERGCPIPHEEMRIAAVDLEGRRLFYKSVKIGPYFIEGGGLTRSGNEILLVGMRGPCILTFLSEEGNITREMNLADHVDPGWRRWLPGFEPCFLNSAQSEGNVIYAFGTMNPMPEVRYPFLVRIEGDRVETLYYNTHLDPYVDVRRIIFADHVYVVGGVSSGEPWESLMYIAKLSGIDEFELIKLKTILSGVKEVVLIDELPERRP
ncbi:MAG: hypothetical protein QXV05_05925 [Candidatus Korarchaeum sp.]